MTGFLFLLLSFLPSGHEAIPKESIYFDIYFAGSRIGHIKADKWIEDGMTTYEVYSVAEYDSWLYDYQRTTHVKAHFRDGVLVKSWAKITEYDDVLELSIAQKRGTAYRMVNRDGDVTWHQGMITASSIQLYFEEPLGIDEIFSESHLVMCRIEEDGLHEYEYHTPEGKTNEYFYKDGKLAKVNIYRSLVTITFKRRP